MSSLATKPTTRRVSFDLRVRFYNHQNECVRTEHVRDMDVRVGFAATSTRVRGALYCDGREAEFAFVLPTFGERQTVDLRYQPRSQIAVRRSVVQLAGSKNVARKVEIQALNPVPRDMEVWLEGEARWSGRVLYAR